MVRRRTARGLKFDEGTVRRKCIRPLSGDISLRALDDDPHVSVLLNPSVPKDAFERSGFPARRWTVFRLLLSSADLGGMKSSRRRRGSGKVESVLCFPVFHRHQAAARGCSG
jgi:hypothetical protein